ncbi:hypothetical protein Hdeb2414_s0012g00389221 [Helianthus debilis subsp. tardiflorus]
MAREEIRELLELCSLLYSLRPGNERDTWVWIGGKNEEFSVGAVKRLMDKDRCRSFFSFQKDVNGFRQDVVLSYGGRK